jgi:hypothetical protein
MLCAYKCTVFKLLNRSVIFPWGEIIDLIQFFSQLMSVYWTFLVSSRLVQCLQKSLALKFCPLNLIFAKWGFVKWRRYCTETFVSLLKDLKA